MIHTKKVWAGLLAAGLIALGAGAMAQGTASVSPEVPVRSASITVTYDATGGPLAAVSPVVLEIGINGFNSPQTITMTGTSPNWTANYSVPANATSLNFYFRNNASSIFDSNGGIGIDWQAPTDGALAFPLGASFVPGGQGGGVVFRVWAPNPTTAAVVGGFNSWGVNADLMTYHAASETWTAHVTAAGATAGAEYKFLFDGTLYRKDPRGRRVVNSVGNSILYNPATYNWGGNDTHTVGPFNELVIYQMHIGTMQGPTPGTFAKVLAGSPSRLDAVAELGVNAIKLLPVFEFPGDNSGGYNLSDPYAVESIYGGPDGLKNFVAACHARGIAVIMDVVHNHYGPNDLDLWNFDNTSDTGAPYFYTTPPLDESGFGPRPNYTLDPVRDFITDNFAMLRDEYKVDGFRWDFTKGIRGVLDGGFNVTADINEGISLIQAVNGPYASNANIISIAEDLGSEPDILTPVGSGGMGFDAEWAVDFHYGIVEELEKALDADRDMGLIASRVGGSFTRVHYTESHDEVWILNPNKERVPYRFDSGNPDSTIARKKASLAAGLLLTSPGIPMIFQGQEMNDPGTGTGSWDDGVALDWNRLATPNVAGIRTMYRDMIRMRRNLDGYGAGLTGANTNVYYSGAGGTQVIAYTRSTGGAQPGDTMVVMANLSATNYSSGFNIGMPAGGTWYEVFNSDRTIYGSDFNNSGAEQTVTASGGSMHGQPASASVTIGPFAVVVLSQIDPATAGVADWQMLR